MTLKPLKYIGVLLLCIGVFTGSVFGQGAAAPFMKPQYLTNSFFPCAACNLYTYAAGTTTPQATYQDYLLVTPNTNPIVLDSLGRPPAGIYLSANSYKFVLQTSAGATVWTQDNIYEYAQLYAGGSTISARFAHIGIGAAADVIYQLSLGGALVNGNATGVGIGVQNPTHALDVNGAVGITAVNPLVWNSDTGISRLAGGSLAFGNGTQGDGTASLQAKKIGLNQAVDSTASIADTQTALGTTSTDGGIFQNTTAAANNSQQWSPRWRFTGQGWKTNATAASQTVDFIIENQTVQGTANPSGNFVLSSQVNGGGYTGWYSWSSGGLFTMSGGYAIGSTSTDGYVLANTTAAAAGAQQFSPRIRLTGQGWQTGTGASQTVDWALDNEPVQGVSNPSTNLVWKYQINGGGYTAAWQLTSAPSAILGTDPGGSDMLRIGGTGRILRLGLGAAADANAPLLASGSASINDIVVITGAAVDNAGFTVANTSTGGKKFQFYSSGASGDGTGNFVIRESTGGSFAGYASNGTVYGMYLGSGNGSNALDATYVLQLPNSASKKAKANAWDTYSDARFKPDAVPLTGALATLLKLQPKTGNQYDGAMINGVPVFGSKTHKLYFLAQELYGVVPDAVNKPVDDSKELWGVNYDMLIPLNTGAIQEEWTQRIAGDQGLQNQITALQTRIACIIANPATFSTCQ